MREKLNDIVISRLDFGEATIREAVDFLKKTSVELDTAEPNAAKRGVNFALKLGEAPAVPAQIPGVKPALSVVRLLLEAREPRVTVNLRNIPLIKALKYVAGLANMRFKVEPYSVTIVPNTPPTAGP